MRYQSIFRPDLFENQTIIITGGGSGIGRAAAHELASLGAHVVLAARKEERLQKVQQEIQSAEGQASYYLCDVRKEDQVANLFEQVLKERGAVHALFNNGGGQYLSPADQIQLKGWNAVIETNLTGTFLMCRQAYRSYMGEHGGAIVTMLMENWRGYPGMLHSGAARAGIENMVKTLAVEWASVGIRINGVAPGTINSSGLQTYGEAAQPLIQRSRQDVPMKRLGSESEIAAAVTFLLSPAASYISGEVIKADGASSLWRKPWEIEDHSNAPTYNGFIES